jgi:hypothetical protein
MHKFLSADQLISDRFIASELKMASLVLIKQQTDKRKLFQSSNIFTMIPCLEMIKVPLGECCEYTSPCTISRSKKKLPKVAEGIFGNLIRSVSSIDNRLFFREGTPKRYANALKLGLSTDLNFFWIINKYLYCSNGDLEAVNLTALFEEEVSTELTCPSDCPCKDLEDELGCNPCINPLDQEFKCPGFLISGVKTMVSEKLVKIYSNLPFNRTSDNNDETSR